MTNRLAVALGPREVVVLARRPRASSGGARLAQRATMVPLSAAGLSNTGSSIFDVIDLVGSGCSRRHPGGAVEHDPRVVVPLIPIPAAGPFDVFAGEVRGL